MLVIVLEDANTYAVLVPVFEVFSLMIKSSAQLIHPKLVKLAQKSPATTSQASNPPSGGGPKSVVVESLGCCGGSFSVCCPDCDGGPSGLCSMSGEDG